METKVFEVLAPGTKSAAIAIKLAPLGGTEARIAQSAGFGEGRLLVGTLKPHPNAITYDKFHWLHGTGGVEQNGMMFLVHEECESRWDELTSGDTLDLTARWEALKDELARLRESDD